MLALVPHNTDVVDVLSEASGMTGSGNPELTQRYTQTPSRAFGNGLGSVSQFPPVSIVCEGASVYGMSNTSIESNSVPRAPDELLSCSLPDWIKIIWIVIRKVQGNNPHAFASHRHYAELCRKGKSNIGKAIQILVRLKWITKNGRYLACHIGLSDDESIASILSESTLYKQRKVVGSTTPKSPQKVVGSTPKVVGSTPKVVGSTTRTESYHLIQSINPEGWREENWQYVFATRFWDRLDELEALSPSLKRYPPKQREATLQQWADVFDKLHRIDKYTQDEISSVMKWLLTPHNWWIKTKNIRSANKLREKKDGESRFDLFVARMEADKATSKEARLLFDLSQPQRRRDIPRIVEAFPGLTPEDFYAAGDVKGDPLVKVLLEKRLALGVPV